MINQIQEDTGAEIAIEDDGTVFISSEGGEAAKKAKEEAEKKAAAPAEESNVDFTHEAEISYDDSARWSCAWPRSAPART